MNEVQISEALHSLHRRAAHDVCGQLRSGAASAQINRHEVTLTVEVRPNPSKRSISVRSDYTVDGEPVRVPDLVGAIGGCRVNVETQEVDVLAVLRAEIERAGGEAFPAGRALIATRDAVVELLAEAKKIEASIHELDMTCDTFSAAIARAGGVA